MRLNIWFSLMMIFSSLSLFSNEINETRSMIGISHAIANETDDYKNSFASIDFLLVPNNDNMFKFGIEFKLMGSLEKNVNPMISFAAIPTMVLDVYGFSFEFGTGAVLNHNNGNKIGEHSIATKLMIKTMRFGKVSLRGGGYIFSNSPFNGLASVGIMYEI